LIRFSDRESSCNETVAHHLRVDCCLDSLRHHLGLPDGRIREAHQQRGKAYETICDTINVITDITFNVITVNLENVITTKAYEIICNKVKM
jgi:hypothetical protein